MNSNVKKDVWETYEVLVRASTSVLDQAEAIDMALKSNNLFSYKLSAIMGRDLPDKALGPLLENLQDMVPSFYKFLFHIPFL